MVAGLWTREQGGKGTVLGLDRQKGLRDSSLSPGSLRTESCKHPSNQRPEVVRILVIKNSGEPGQLGRSE